MTTRVATQKSLETTNMAAMPRWSCWELLFAEGEIAIENDSKTEMVIF